MKSPVGNVLLLGMVYSEEFEPKRGQEFRDRVRCEAVEKLGYAVKTLDTKHSDAVISKHCQADFTEPRRMLKSMKSRWPDCQFQDIILDYFFSPVGWARERWTDGLYAKTIPEIARQCILKEGGRIWLPNLNCIKESLEYFIDVITEYYDVDLVSDPKMNPLYLATEDVTDELKKCPDLLTNETQLKPILDHSDMPFYCLTLRRTTGVVSPEKSNKKRKLAASDAAQSPDLKQETDVKVVTPASTKV